MIQKMGGEFLLEWSLIDKNQEEAVGERGLGLAETER